MVKAVCRTREKWQDIKKVGGVIAKCGRSQSWQKNFKKATPGDSKANLDMTIAGE